MFPLLPDPTAPGDPDALRSEPAGLLDRLLAGNRRFVAGRPRYGHRIGAAVAAANEPRPYALVLACRDARVAVEAILDQDFGDLLVVRSAGNVADRTALASIELAVAAFGIRLVLVLGHTRCAAVARAVDTADTRLPGRHARQVLDEIRAAIPAAHNGPAGVVAATTDNHVRRTVASLSAALPGATGTERIGVTGARYDVATGRITVL
jgi:carbonic anhydrase